MLFLALASLAVLTPMPNAPPNFHGDPNHYDFDMMWRDCMDVLVEDVRRRTLLKLPATRAEIIQHVQHEQRRP